MLVAVLQGVALEDLLLLRRETVRRLAALMVDEHDGGLRGSSSMVEDVLVVLGVHIRRRRLQHLICWFAERVGLLLEGVAALRRRMG